MITDRYQILSIEEGDSVRVDGKTWVVKSIESVDSEVSELTLVDDDEHTIKMLAEDTDYITIVFD